MLKAARAVLEQRLQDEQRAYNRAREAQRRSRQPDSATRFADAPALKNISVNEAQGNEAARCLGTLAAWSHREKAGRGTFAVTEANLERAVAILESRLPEGSFSVSGSA